MAFQQYVKGKRTINATETAFKAIYEAQGFRLKQEEPIKANPPETEVPDEGTASTGTDGGSTEDNGEGTPARKPKRAKQ